jgi:hypothetical protein
VAPTFEGSLPQLQANCIELEAGLAIQDNCHPWTVSTLTAAAPSELGPSQFRHHTVSDECGNSATFVQFVMLTDGDGATSCDPCNPNTNCGDCSQSCGPNTYWDEALQLCLPQSLSAACYFDTDGNGSVGTPDLLNFLSAFGDDCE